jgi:hypothetical protein
MPRPCLASLLALCAACAGGAAAPRPAAEKAAGARGEFPTEAEVDALARTPGPPRIVSDLEREVDAWSLAQPPAAAPADEAHPATTPWDRLLAAAAAERRGLAWVSEPMACLAREGGQFFLAHQGTPPPELLGFLASRCGVADPGVLTGWVTLPLAGGETDGAILERLRPEVEGALRRALAGGSQAAGLWYGRDRARAVAYYVASARRIRFEAFPEAPGSDGRVAVRGELLVPADRLVALVTHGRYGFRACAADPAVPLPRFSFSCEVNPADDSARLELAAFAPARLTGPVVASTWLWPRGVRAGRWVRPAAVAVPRAPPGEAIGAALVRGLNQVRAEAGLAPVRLEADQSATAVRLAPHYFASNAGLEPEAQLEPIVLGLRAGWRVQGAVVEGFFTSAMVREREPGRLLAAALARPSGREALLDARVTAVAVGPVDLPAEGVVGAVFASYRLVDPAAEAREAEEVVRRIDAARKERGLGPAPVLADLRPAAAEAARAVEQGQRTPEAALKALVDQVANTVHGHAQAWFVAADRIDRLELPERLLSTPGLRVVVGVTHYRRPGSPWARTGALIVAAAPAGTVLTRAD